MNFLNPDFYPTPEAVTEKMLHGWNLEGAVVVEPSAGSGNIVKACIEREAAEVLAFEPEPELRAILATTGCHLIGSDWLKATAESISYADFIIANPPFSADEHHILHAWKIAPPGATIISLCNSTTLHKTTAKCLELRALVEAYGAFEDLGPCFKNAERQTGVMVSMIGLKKPGERSAQTEFRGFFLEPDEIEAQGEGIIPHRRSRELVNRYIEGCRLFDEQLKLAVQMDATLNNHWRGNDLCMRITQDGCNISRNRFRKNLQKSMWDLVINEMLPRHLITSHTKKDIDLFVEQQHKIPFTERNLYQMLQILIGTTEQRFEKALLSAFEALTKHTHGNRWHVPGWKTNESYLFTPKFIVDEMIDSFDLKMMSKYKHETIKISCFGYATQRIQDLTVVIARLNGITNPIHFLNPRKGYNDLVPGTWYDWGFFKFKVFKKGSGHFVFNDKQHWISLNRAIAKLKGKELPEATAACGWHDH